MLHTTLLPRVLVPALLLVSACRFLLPGTGDDSEGVEGSSAETDTDATSTTLDTSWVTRTDPLLPKMVDYAAAKFVMGSADSTPQAEPAEKPAHEVEVGTFALDLTEVTIEAYQRCVAAKKCTPSDVEGDGINNSGYDCNGARLDRRDYPINCITWQQARAYCVWLGKRLPSESEWEYAARGKTGRLYPWGNESADCKHAVMRGCGGPDVTRPVGSKPEGDTPEGVHDLAGNVYEWVDGCPAEDYQPTSVPDCERAVLRGGSYTNTDPWVLSATNRFLESRTTRRNSTIGVRCAK